MRLIGTAPTPGIVADGAMLLTMTLCVTTEAKAGIVLVLRMMLDANGMGITEGSPKVGVGGAKAVNIIKLGMTPIKALVGPTIATPDGPIAIGTAPDGTA